MGLIFLRKLAGKDGIKAVYDLQSYWTSMAAIFTFLIGRMTDVLAPDIYGDHCFYCVDYHVSKTR
jgi:hypothetical protein